MKTCTQIYTYARAHTYTRAYIYIYIYIYIYVCVCIYFAIFINKKRLVSEMEHIFLYLHGVDTESTTLGDYQFLVYAICSLSLMMT